MKEKIIKIGREEVSVAEIFLDREKEENKEELYDLWAQCFHDTKEYMDYYFDEKLKDNEILAYEQEEQLVSMLHLNPYRLSVNEVECEAAYIVGVATKEEYRKRGIMRKLLVASLKEMYSRKQPFTYLMPASEAIYAPFDFRYIYSQNRVRLTRNEDNLLGSQSQRTDLVSKEVQVYSYDKLMANQQEEVVEWVNRKLAKEFQIYTKRSIEYYNRLSLEMKVAGGDVIIYYKEDAIIGVLCYMEEEWAEVAESIIETEYTYEIVYYLAKGRDKISFLETYFLDLNKTKELGYELTYEDKPIIMARIVNLHSLLGLMHSKQEFSLVISVKDSILTQNQGTFLLEMNQKKGVLTNTDKHPDITLDIANLTNFLFGSIDLEELCQKNKIMISEETRDKLNLIEKLQRVYINEIV